MHKTLWRLPSMYFVSWAGIIRARANRIHFYAENFYVIHTNNRAQQNFQHWQVIQPLLPPSNFRPWKEQHMLRSRVFGESAHLPTSTDIGAIRIAIPRIPWSKFCIALYAAQANHSQKCSEPTDSGDEKLKFVL